MNKGVLFVMSGPSGTGKGTICTKLLETEDIFLSVSSTTREIRKGEQDGVTYNYVTKDEFERMIADGEMLEYASYSGNYYGTPKTAVNKSLDEGKNVLLEIEVQGAEKVKAAFPEAVLIFIIPPSMAELKKRLTERGREDEEQILTRMETAREELKKSALYTKIIKNDNLDTCVCEVADYIKSVVAARRNVDNLLQEEY